MIVPEWSAALQSAMGHSYDGWVLGHCATSTDSPSSLRLLRVLRQQGRRTPAVVIASEDDRTLPSECHRLGATCLFEPVDAKLLGVFVARLGPRSAYRVSTHFVDRVSVERSLTIREAQVARLIARGSEREGLAEALRISENSVKGLVRGLLRKTGFESVEAFRRAVLERALRSEGEPTREGHVKT